MWHELPGYAGLVRWLEDCRCQVYAVSDNVWRWEVLRRSPRAGHFSLERAGTRIALLQAIAAAEGYVEASQQLPPA